MTEGGKYHDYTYVEITACANYSSRDVIVNPVKHTESVWVNPRAISNLELTFESQKSLKQYVTNFQVGILIDDPHKLPVRHMGFTKRKIEIT